MNPLDRELRRRRRVAARASAFVAVLLVGSAGVITPAVLDHRAIVTTVHRRMQDAAEAVRLGTEAAEFEARACGVLDDAERNLVALAPASDLPWDYRARARARLITAGAAVGTIHVGERTPLVEDFEALDNARGDALLAGGLCSVTYVDVEGTVAWPDVARLLAAVRRLEPLARIVEFQLDRDAERDGVLSFQLRLAHVHLDGGAVDNGVDPEEG